MDSLLVILNWLLPLLYLALLVDRGSTFFFALRRQRWGGWVPLVVAIHASFLTLRALRLGYPPLANEYEILSLVALLMAAIFWLLETAGRDRRAGAFVFLLVFLLQYTSSVFLAGTIGHVTDQHVQYGWARLHVVPAVAAYTALSLAGVHGLLHLVALGRLKKRSFGMLFDRLPALDLLGKLTWYALVVGFVFMTISLATGPLLLAHDATGQGSIFSQPKLASKIIIGSLAWLVFLAAVLGKVLLKWPAVWISRLAVCGFVVVMALLVASAVLS